MTQERIEAANRERVLAKQKEYEKANRAKIAERFAAYYAKYPEKRWVNSYQNRAKARGLKPVVEGFTKQDVIERYGDSCHYCTDGAFEELDHHVPVAAGGHHTLGNVRPSCASCNNEKSKADKLSAEQFRLANA